MLRLKLLIAVTCVVTLAVAVIAGQQSAPPQRVAVPAAAPSPHQTTIGRYCVTCHNSRLRTGGLALDDLDLSNIGARGDVWEKVIVKIRSGAMPPLGQPRPDAQTVESLVTGLESELDAFA